MKVALTPNEPFHLRVRYNGEQIFEKHIAAGEKFDQDIETPKVTGKAEVFMVDGDEEMLFATAEYTFEDESAAHGCGCGATDTEAKATK